MGRPPRNVKVSMPLRLSRCSTICRVTASSHQVSVCTGGGGPPGAVYFACAGASQSHQPSGASAMTVSMMVRMHGGISMA